MSRRGEFAILAAAIAILLAGAALGAAGAMVARTVGVPTTSAAPFAGADHHPVTP